MKKIRFLFLGLLCFLPLLQSCSINRMAINAVSNALTGTGSSDVFTSDPDPELVGDAMPFAIKMYETLLAQNPNHQGLLLTTGSLFVMYANAFVQGPAQLMDPLDYFEERSEAFDRAKQLYIRGHSLLMSAMDKKYPGFSSALVEDGSLGEILKKVKKDDVPMIYWAVAGGLAAYSIDLFDLDLGFRIPEWNAMMARAYELDPDFNNGAIDEFYIQFYAAMPENMGGDKEKARVHFLRALEKTNFKSAGPYVSYARAIAIPAQDYDAFKENLEKALAIDPDENPSNRLVNILAQRKAKHLLDIADEYFSF